jgi:hypothetical protein
VALVDFVLDQDLSLALGLGAEFELGMSLPVILRQRGTGTLGISSQRGVPLEPTAERDPRLGVARAMSISGTLRAKPRAELAIPAGITRAFASAGAVTLAPGMALEWTLGAVSIGADLALRLRPSATLGSARLGSQAQLALGVSYDVFEQPLLAIGVEAWLAPSLIETTSGAGRASGVETTYLPAEWLLSVRSHPEPRAPWSIALGAGAGLALSHETWNGDTIHFLGPTTPSLRALVEIRYAPTE